MLKLCGFDPWMAISNIMSGFGDSTSRRQRLLSPSSLSDMQTTDRRCCSVDSLSGRMLNLAISGPELKEGATTTSRVKMRPVSAQDPACRESFLAHGEDGCLAYCQSYSSCRWKTRHRQRTRLRNIRRHVATGCGQLQPTGP